MLAASEADRDSLPARLVTRVVCIGPAHPPASYLRSEMLVQAALGTGCDAVHPGYGFLSERAAFARLCEQHGLIFIGPTAAQIEAVGDKLRRAPRRRRRACRWRPGGEAHSRESARELASSIGMPLLVKAVGGGGGRGMKLVERAQDLDAALELAAAEAGAAFGDARVYLERYREPCAARGSAGAGRRRGQCGAPRANATARCSAATRSSSRRRRRPDCRWNCASSLHDAALRFAARLEYRGAGTVEFLVDVARDEFYFLEMNARIQVEHPVTEVVSGVDIVAAQIAIAAGQGLRLARGESLRARAVPSNAASTPRIRRAISRPARAW